MINRSISNMPARYIVLVWFFGGLALPLDWVFEMVGYPSAEHWYDLSYYYGFQFLLALFALAVLFSTDTNIGRFFGPLPTLSQTKSTLTMALYLWVQAAALAYLIWFPLSFYLGDFVDQWYLDAPPIVYFQSGTLLILPNILSLISLCVLAPILEEIVFRGFLLHRWANKFGLLRAVLLSSLIFGVGHADVIASMCFGIGMCVIYLTTQSLLTAIVIHALWNLACWLLELLDKLTLGFNYQ